MSFTSVLQHIGHDVLAFFKIATEAATIAEPFVATAFPAVSGIYQTTLMSIVNAEAVGTAAAAQGNTGPQKLALVLAAITPTINSELSQLGVTMNQAQISKYVSAVVASLNLIPAPQTGAPNPITAALSAPAVAPAFASNLAQAPK